MISEEEYHVINTTLIFIHTESIMDCGASYMIEDKCMFMLHIDGKLPQVCDEVKMTMADYVVASGLDIATARRAR